MKKMNASKYRYPLSDGSWFVIDEARAKAKIVAAGGNPNVKPAPRHREDMTCLPCKLPVMCS